MKSFRNVIATGTALLALPLVALALDSPGTPSAKASVAGQAEAAQMVAANADLLHNISSRSAHPGQKVTLKLRTTAHLTNGTKLPSGTIITGHVVKSSAYPTSQSRLAINFNQARLKDGKVVPIKATIVGVYAPQMTGFEGYPVTPGNQVPVEWSNKTVQVDQINAVPNVSLHSNVAKKDSGILVSNKNNLKLRNGSEIQLAIAPQGQVS